MNFSLREFAYFSLGSGDLMMQRTITKMKILQKEIFITIILKICEARVNPEGREFNHASLMIILEWMMSLEMHFTMAVQYLPI